MIEFKLDKNKCKGCGLCMISCPKKNLKLAADFNNRGVRYAKIKDALECSACGACYLMCPDSCIEIYEKK